MRKILLFSILIMAFVLQTESSFAQEQKSKDLYSFGGHVFAPDFPIELGYADLIDFNNPPNILQRAIIDTLGYYYFYRIPAGQYFVHAGPDPSDPSYDQWSFTYYPNSYTWEDADVIDLKETSWEYDINLVPLAKQSEIGPGNISGTIQIFEEKPFAENIDVILCDENLTPMQHILSNSTGEFFFDDLIYGNYILYPQVTGLTTQPISIHISEGQTEFTDIEITIKDGFIASFINEELISDNSFMCYPNPASSQVNISFEMLENAQINTRIFDLSGRLVYETLEPTSYGINAQQIDISNWVNGIYLLDITVDQESAIRYKFSVVH